MWRIHDSKGSRRIYETVRQKEEKIKQSKDMKTNINENAQSSASQKARILEYMRQGHSISPMEALNLFGCFRLGARIADIKGEGYLIRTDRVKDPRTGKYYASYSLV